MLVQKVLVESYGNFLIEVKAPEYSSVVIYLFLFVGKGV